MPSKISILKWRSPREILRAARQTLSASWSLRNATSVGKYNRLVGRLRVVNYGRLMVGTKVIFNARFANSVLVIGNDAEMTIGDHSYINYGADMCAYKRIEIGEKCRIGTHCIIMDSDFHHVELERRDERPTAEAVVIEPQVWIGSRVTILRGVRIGYGSVIAAGSVVTKSIPPMSIAGGVPAKVIRSITEQVDVQLPVADWRGNRHEADMLLKA